VLELEHYNPGARMFRKPDDGSPGRETLIVGETAVALALEGVIFGVPHGVGRGPQDRHLDLGREGRLLQSEKDNVVGIAQALQPGPAMFVRPLRELGKGDPESGPALRGVLAQSDPDHVAAGDEPAPVPVHRKGGTHNGFPVGGAHLGREPKEVLGLALGLGEVLVSHGGSLWFPYP